MTGPTNDGTGSALRPSVTRMIVTGAIAGVAAALAAMGVLHLLGVELSPIIFATVVGAVAGSVVPSVIRQKP